MYDTTIVVVGNVLTAPEWRRTNNSNQLVANFRVVSTARRYDRETKSWVDGNTLRLRVCAWRKLGENVAASLRVGDPVIVYGRMYTRDWQDAESNHRVSYEMEALAVGQDLARGRSRFYRTRPGTVSTVEDGAGEAMIGAEQSEPVHDGETPVRFGDGVPDEGEPDFLEVVAGLVEEPAAPVEEAEEETPGTAEVRRGRRSRREPVPA